MNLSMMKTLFIAAILVLITSMIQGGIWHFVAPNLAVPNLSLVVILAVALQQRSVRAVWFAALLGLLSDVCTGDLLGPQMGAAVVVAATVTAVVNRLFFDSRLTIGVIAAGTSVEFSIVRTLLAIQFSPRAYQSASSIALEALFTAIAGTIFIRPIVRRLARGSRDDNDFDRVRTRRL